MITTSKDGLIVKNIGQQSYEVCYEAMQKRIENRIKLKRSNQELTADELWLVEHSSVFTLGQAADESHILSKSNVPTVKVDRGGQVTWHGEGQLVAYFLFDIESLGWHVRQLVDIAETCICEVITPYLKDDLYAKARKDAPGVYVFDSKDNQLGKIASLGFKIKRGFSYHGIAININADLSPFLQINPCGYSGMTMLNLSDVSEKPLDLKKISQEFSQLVIHHHS